MKNLVNVIFAIALPCFASTGASVDPVLEIVIGGQVRHLGRDELLRRPDVAHVEVANDVSYGGPRIISRWSLSPSCSLASIRRRIL
jgi:hypothetical protein